MKQIRYCKTLALALALALTSALSLVMCTPKTQNYERQAIPVQVMRVTTAQQQDVHTYVGTLEDEVNTSLSFPIHGTIVSVPVHVGQQVKKGQILMRVDNTQAQAMLASAKAKLKQAEDGYKRVKAVYDKGVVSEVKMVEVITARDEATAIVKTLTKQLDNCTLRSPSDGVVGQIHVKAGENVLPNQPVMTLLGEKGLNVSIAVPESEAIAIHLGDSAVVRVNALENISFGATVTERALLANPMTHAYTVTFSSRNIPSDLLPGMVCRVALTTNTTRGFILPAECVQTTTTGKVVWCEQDGIAKRVEVTTGDFVRQGVLITSGLQTGDYVIVSGFQKLYNGCEVTVRP